MKNAKMYRQAKVKIISKKIQKKRLAYRKENKSKSFNSSWQYVCFTDRAHINLRAVSDSRILREEDDPFLLENF